MLTSEQIQVRRTGIGGSDAAAIAGLSRYKSNVDVYLEKIGMSNVDFQSDAAYWGNVLEPVVADEYSRRTGKTVLVEERLLQSDKYPWMIANVDRVIANENAILECKTCSAFKYKEWGADGTDDVPDEYLLQCAHYAIVTDAKYVDLAVLMGGQHFGIYTYNRNKKLEQSLIEIEHDFWHKHVLLEEPPEPKTYQDVCKLFENGNGQTKKITDEIASSIKKYSFLQKQIKGLTKEVVGFKTEICKYLGNNSILLNEYGEEMATWKNKKTNRFDVSLFKLENPELYQKFIKTTENREFRLKELEND